MLSVGEFEVNVQELATDLRNSEAGDGISVYQRSLAYDIAGFINDNRDTVKNDYIDPNPDFLPTIHEKIADARREYSVSFDRSIVPEMSAVEADLKADYARRQRIGTWLGGILPKRVATLVKPEKVYSTLIGYPELSFQYQDDEEAEVIIREQEQAHRTEVLKSLEFKPLEGEKLFKLADDLFRLILDAAKEERPQTKIEMYQSEEFRRLLTNGRKPSNEEVRQAFNDAWEIINATFTDYDVEYQLFEYSGETKARKYILSEPEVAEVIWAASSVVEEAELQEEENEDQKYRGFIIGVQGSVIMFENGDPIKLDSDIKHLAARKLFAQGRNTFMGSTRLVQEVTSELGMTRGLVQSDVSELLSSLGPNYIERQFSSKKNKLMIRLKPVNRY